MVLNPGCTFSLTSFFFKKMAGFSLRPTKNCWVRAKHQSFFRVPGDCGPKREVPASSSAKLTNSYLSIEKVTSVGDFCTPVYTFVSSAPGTVE